MTKTRIKSSPLDDHAEHSDVIWLAGLLEGEGCFGNWQGVRRYGMVNVETTDCDIADRAGRLMGGVVRNAKHRGPWSRKTMWKVCVYGYRARRIMEEILPYMGTRRSKTISELLALPYWGFPESRGGHGALKV